MVTRRDDSPIGSRQRQDWWWGEAWWSEKPRSGANRSETGGQGATGFKPSLEISPILCEALVTRARFDGRANLSATKPLRVCLESHAERATRRSRMMAEAAYRKALAEAMVASKSLARRRFRPIQAKKRSTTQRRA